MSHTFRGLQLHIRFVKILALLSRKKLQDEGYKAEHVGIDQLQLHHADKYNGVPYGLFLGPKVSQVICTQLLVFCESILPSSLFI